MSRTKADIMSGVSKPVIKAKKVANNTFRIEYEDGTTAIRLHDTDIVTWLTDGNIRLNTGGWQTMTTKDRINEYTPVNIYQAKNVWYIGDWRNNGTSPMFYDGIVVDALGSIIGEIKQADMKAINTKKREIAKFVKLITPDNLPMPSNGDCWFCLFRDEKGKTWGDNVGQYDGHDHLQQHIEDGYIHGSLLVNAMREKGYRDEQIGFHYQLKFADRFRDAVRKYMQKRLIQNIAVG